LFSVSAGLVGVCLTVIGIIRIGINLDAGYTTIADELLAADAFCFAAACLLAYSSIRSPAQAKAKRLEGYADRLFMVGMTVMCVISAIVAFSFL
jgi:hypothetical protein